jgi:hypothetical protein
VTHPCSGSIAATLSTQGRWESEPGERIRNNV